MWTELFKSIIGMSALGRKWSFNRKLILNIYCTEVGCSSFFHKNLPLRMKGNVRIKLSCTSSKGAIIVIIYCRCILGGDKNETNPNIIYNFVINNTMLC